MTTRNVLDLWNSNRLRIGYSHSTMTDDERMQRESSLIATIRTDPLAWTIADNIAFRARDGVLQGNCI
jgi:hypothetical protein